MNSFKKIGVQFFKYFRLTPLSLSFLYTLIALLWIFESGYFLEIHVNDPIFAKQIELAKGVLFVLTTGILLYLLLKSWHTKIISAKNDANRMRNLYAALSQCNQAIIRCQNETELFDQICHDAVEHGGMKMAWIGLADEMNQELKIMAYAGDGSDYLNELYISLNPSEPSAQGPTGTTFRENRPFWCQDFANDPATSLWHEKGKQFGWRSSAALPLHRGGVTCGVLTLYTEEKNAFDEDAQRLLLEMASDIDYALDNFDRNNARLRAEEKFTNSYHLLTSIINTAPIRIFWKDKDLRYLGCNDLFAQDAGKSTPQEIIGKDDTQMSWSQQASLYRADDFQVIQSNIPKLFFEEPQSTPNGDTIWLSTSKVPLYDKDGNSIGILGMYEDITKRKEVESTLVKTHQQLQNLLNSMSEGAYGVDENGLCTFVNHSFLKILGYENEDQIIGQNIHNLIHHSYEDGLPYPIHECSIQKALITQTQVHLDHEVFWTSQNKPIPVEFWANPMYIEDEFVGVMATFIDISKRKKDESTLVLRTQAMEQSPNAVIITDFKANIEYVNTAFIQNTGYTSEEVIGKNPRLLKSGNTPEHAYDEMWMALTNQEKWQGEFINKRKDGTNYIYSINVAPVIDNLGKTTHYIAIEEDISEQKKTQEKIHYLANFDALTGLPNRIQMDEHLQYTLNLAKRNEGGFTLIFLDLDHFKNINDTLGHSMGDLLLVELSKRLSASVREEDTVSRMGGDEFVLLLPHTDVNGAAQVAQKLLESIALPFHLEDHELSVTASLGIALYPADGSDVETLSKNADTAMYRAKQEGRNAYCFFTQEMQKNSQRNLELSNALHNALQRNELYLVYQPQLSAKDGNIIGAEALIRWEHPQFGVVSPAEFIPIAEDNGTILSIGEWVLRTAVSQAAKWYQNAMPLIMSVNLSAVQFRHPDLIRLITDILEEAKLSHEFLEIELTEGVAMHNPQDAIQVMNALHAIGIRMSIDDFGTGYSSLAYLKQFKVYKLKIDQSFVRDITTDPDDKAIVNAVIQLAHSLDLITIAEGVETLDQLQYLQQQGCDEIQGYYYSKPLLATTFEQFYQSHPNTYTVKE